MEPQQQHLGSYQQQFFHDTHQQQHAHHQHQQFLQAASPYASPQTTPGPTSPYATIYYFGPQKASPAAQQSGAGASHQLHHPLNYPHYYGVPSVPGDLQQQQQQVAVQYANQYGATSTGSEQALTTNQGAANQYHAQYTYTQLDSYQQQQQPYARQANANGERLRCGPCAVSHGDGLEAPKAKLANGGQVESRVGGSQVVKIERVAAMPGVSQPERGAKLNRSHKRARQLQLQNGEQSINGTLVTVARRKNATRESTSVLKEWLVEHTMNPYPTKGEKVMLTIIANMSLTQISTWFANARRRMKKENRAHWLTKGSGGASCRADRPICPNLARLYREKFGSTLPEAILGATNGGQTSPRIRFLLEKHKQIRAKQKKEELAEKVPTINRDFNNEPTNHCCFSKAKSPSNEGSPRISTTTANV